MHVRSLSRLVAITCYQKNGAVRAKTDSKIKRCEETKGGGVGIVGTAGGGDGEWAPRQSRALVDEG